MQSTQTFFSRLSLFTLKRCWTYLERAPHKKLHNKRAKGSFRSLWTGCCNISNSKAVWASSEMIQIVRRPQIGQRTSSVPQEPEIYSQIFEINTFINVSKMTKIQKSPKFEGYLSIGSLWIFEWNLREFLTKKEFFAAQMRLFSNMECIDAFLLPILIRFCMKANWGGYSSVFQLLFLENKSMNGRLSSWTLM